jgi:GNAT superfamily N-acetyltransferase
VHLPPDLLILDECFRSLAVIPGATLIDDHAICGVMTPVPHTFFNGVGVSRAPNEDAVLRVLERFRAHGRPFRWWVAPDSTPATLGELLAANGMRKAFDSTGMWMDLASIRETPLPDDVTIRRVATRAEMETWAHVLLTGFRHPLSDAPIWVAAYEQLGLYGGRPWAHFIAFVDGEPVATSSLLLRGALAGIYHVVTLPAARGRGIGAAITAAAMRYARDAGARTAALQASAMGLSVYRALGFVAASELRLYDWRP